MQHVSTFFDLVCAFVTSCFKAEKLCIDSFESKRILESYEKVLISWTAIKSCLDLSEMQKDLIYKMFSRKIFNGFIESRLNNLEENTIFRFQEEEILIKNNKSDTSESENDLDNDFDCYKEVLYSIGDFAKYSLDYCLPVLSK